MYTNHRFPDGRIFGVWAFVGIEVKYPVPGSQAAPLVDGRVGISTVQRKRLRDDGYQLVTLANFSQAALADPRKHAAITLLRGVSVEVKSHGDRTGVIEQLL